MKNTLIFFILAYIPLAVNATPFSWPQLTPKQIGSKTYVIEHGPHDENKKLSRGFHNNPGFVITRDGVVVIDTGSSVEIGKMILRKIEKLTDKPVTHIFNTHFHGDHWLANQALLEKYPSARTIAHPKLIALLKAGQDKFWIDVFTKRLGDDFKGTKAVIPAEAAASRDYKIGGMTFTVKLFDQAHTATDLMVFVKEDAVLFTGDIVNNEHFSFMGHGNFKGAYEATQWALAQKPKYVVVGHGRSGTQDLIPAFADIYKTLRDTVIKYYDQGLQDYEIKPKLIAALSKYKHWSGFESQVGRYASLLVAEVEAEQFQ
ncbi:MAG: MBL fold metallo-hydrolase [Gammaproteobacteria bacterium]|nr:MBL fold metallo-hydrolase [Gammaproteobacteria bacterium]